MNFFAQEEHARRSSRRLVWLFVLAVVAVVVAIDALAVIVGWGVSNYASVPGQAGEIHLDFVRLAWISVATLLLIGVASLYRSISLRSGGGASVARSLGATPVPPDTNNFAWKRLRNVIEEIAIASGVPVPEIYVMEHEAGINAFAAGYSPSDAAVCVTQGCLDKLTRDEMQGVIAHEFSHVLNGDMRLNIRLIGLLFGILVLGMLGRLLMYSGGRVSSSRSRGSGNSTVYIAVIGIALLAIGYIGYFFGRLIQAAVARSRESLADASAVQFTRQSSGIAGALKKIAALSEGSSLEAHEKQEVAHMLFGEGSQVMSWFATHPPLLERIKTLDPAFDPAELDAITRAWQQPRQASPAQRDTDQDEDDDASLAGFEPLIFGAAVMAGAGASARAAGSALPDADATTRVDANTVTAQVATPGTDDYRAAFGLHRSIPPELKTAARDPQQSPALVLALALSR
ncbi:MAG: M48 family metallopeptidase, partial [Xanthomonadales bacterium]|nr:M48 family metallopeptidase [Xanthomonadales bacterium]